MQVGHRGPAWIVDPRLRAQRVFVNFLAIGGGLLMALGGYESHPYGLGHLFTLWYVYVGIAAVLASGIVNLGMLIWSRRNPLPPG